MAYFKVTFQHSTDKTEEIHKEMSITITGTNDNMSRQVMLHRENEGQFHVPDYQDLHYHPTS